MLLLMNRLSWSLIQSLKTNARIPAVSSRKKMIPRNTENCQEGGRAVRAPSASVHAAEARIQRTNFSRKVFSRRAPMQPAKPRMNMTPPTTTKSQTGSRPPRSVMEEMLDRTPWRRDGARSVRVKL